ncbi:MAG: hypothetical protein IPP57_06185 [Candidatus Obscuribacter sp.]|nr:hypothetical protein [Candidatus Obscuribacter sp.]MBK9770402.1 hypothetical protein [Candidatus Obscuribacter sp.]MDQ5967281.1 hypothetical protein [Cyanobacteriota bacterium erpe_2018_sw_39hr_WHONDRS-SW48-000098_B_bin.30]
MKRGKRGQSMVEYALGIGCVAALCVVALGSLGHIAGDMVWKVEQATNYGGTKSSEPGRTIKNTGADAQPWIVD